MFLSAERQIGGMGFLDFIFGKSDRGNYSFIGAWVKTKYGDRFRDGMSRFEVEGELNNVLHEIGNTDLMKKRPGMMNAFQGYVQEGKYGELVKVKE